MSRKTTVRDAATVRVSAPVDGTVSRNYPDDRRPANLVSHLKVDPRVMEVAHRARRAGEMIQIISATEVRLVPR